MKKYFLVSTVILALALPASAMLIYTTNNNTITITGYTDCDGVVTIPSIIDGLPVTSIGDQAFADCTNLTSVTIPDSVISIGKFSFSQCISLTNVMIPDSVVSIGGSAFYGCSSLPSVTIPDSVTSIGYYAFNYCASLTNVTIGNSVASIEDFTFSNCTNLIGVTIPDSVTSIGARSFFMCLNLASVTIGNNVTRIRSEAFFGCISLTSVTIPNSVLSLGEGVFYSCVSLTNVTIPNSLTSIDDSAFGYCSSLTSIKIPSSLTSLGVAVFSDCARLTAISVDELNSVFSSLDGILFDKSQTKLIQYLGGRAGSYTIPNGVIGIRKFAFTGCPGLTSVTIGDSVASIEYYAFSSCTNLTNATIGNSVSSIGNNVFYGCAKLASVTIGNSVTNIGNNVFTVCTSLIAITVDELNSAYSSLGGVLFNKSQTTLILYPGGRTESNYTISNGVTEIGKWAFADCTNLANVTIPNSVASLGNGAFYDCVNLEGLYFQGNAPSIGSSVFEGVGNTVVYYRAGTTGWEDTFGGIPAVLLKDTATVALGRLSQTYDGAAKTATATTTPSGLTVYFTYNGSTNPPINAGSYLVIGTVNDPMYTGSASGTLTVLPAPLRVTGIVGVSKVYDGMTSVAISTSGATFNGVLSTDVGKVTLVTSGASGAFADKTAGTNKLVMVSGLTLSGSAVRNYTLIQPTLTANITPTGLTISSLAAFSRVYDGTTVATLTGTPVATGVIGNDAVALSGIATGAFGDKAVGDNKPVTISGLTLSGTDAGNYTLSLPLLSANITPVSLTVAGVTAASKVYDGTTSAAIDTTGATLNGVLSADVGQVTLQTSGASGVFADKTAGTNKPVMVTGLALAGTDAGNYTLIQPTLTADIMAIPEIAIVSITNVVMNPFGFTITGTNVSSVVVEACTNLINPEWSPIWTNTLTGEPSNFSDPDWTNYPARFYRLRSQ